MPSSSRPGAEHTNIYQLRGLSRTSSRIALLIGLATAVLFVALDLFIECRLLPGDSGCFELLFNPEPVRMWSRLAGIVVILLLAVFSLILLRRHENNEARLARSGLLLEELTVELQEKNAALNKEIDHRKVMEQKLETLAVTDQLTGVYNRRKFDEILHMLIRQEVRYPRGLSLLMMDLDHFKAINDRYGHSVGDEILREFASLVLQTKREADDMFRVGGEEFCLITFSESDDKLKTVAEKVCLEIAEHVFPKVGHLTVSIGAARFAAEDSYDTLFKRADDALYLAKHRGRNQVATL
jgi:diguanylate cyclase (GGDEF)-like protein